MSVKTDCEERRIPLNISDIIIDPEFRDKIPRQTEDEFAGLREDIIRDGYVRDPLTVWKEENILLDGHHRWNVITENWELLRDKFTVIYRSFPDRWAAIEWICANQLHKRNLTAEQKTYMVGKMYEARKNTNAFKGNQYTAQSGDGQNVHNQTDREVKDGTSGEIGKEVGMNARSVRRAEKYAKGVDKIREVDPETADKILSGESTATKTAVQELSKAEPEAVKAATEKIKAGETVEVETIKSLRGYKEPLVQRTSTLDGTTKKVAEEFADVLEDLNLTADTFLRQFEKTLRENRKIVKGNLAEVVSVMERVKKSLEKMERRF